MCISSYSFLLLHTIPMCEFIASDLFIWILKEWHLKYISDPLQDSFENSQTYSGIHKQVYGECIHKNGITGSWTICMFTFTRHWQKISRVFTSPAMHESSYCFTFPTTLSVLFICLLVWLAWLSFLNKIVWEIITHWTFWTSYNL